MDTLVDAETTQCNFSLGFIFSILCKRQTLIKESHFSGRVWQVWLVLNSTRGKIILVNDLQVNNVQHRKCKVSLTWWYGCKQASSYSS